MRIFIRTSYDNKQRTNMNGPKECQGEGNSKDTSQSEPRPIPTQTATTRPVLSLDPPDKIIQQLHTKPHIINANQESAPGVPIFCPELDAYKPAANIDNPAILQTFTPPIGRLRVEESHESGNTYWFGYCEYNDGRIYYGEWKNGKHHGTGKLIHPDNSIYYGEWKNGNRHGTGKSTNSDGSAYIGRWRNDVRDGFGCATFVDGSAYDGCWKNDMRHGRGNYKYPRESYMEGKWDTGNLFHTFGVFVPIKRDKATTPDKNINHLPGVDGML